MAWLMERIAARRDRRRCFHHDQATGTSWVTGQLIDLGRRKMWRCRECGRTWFW